MSSQPFLKNKKYTFTIAKLAVGIQSFFTLIIVILLLCTISSIPYYPYLLVSFLGMDIVFVCVHLLYRVLYSGQKVLLTKFEKQILSGHIVASLLALSITSYTVIHDDTFLYTLMCVALSSWIVSLMLGILFFVKKYKEVLVK